MNLNQLQENKLSKVDRVLREVFGANINFSAETAKLQAMSEATQNKINQLRESGVDVSNKQYQKLLLVAEGFTEALSDRVDESADLDTAEVLLAAKQMADDLQKMAENLASMQVEDLMSITNAMKEEVGTAEAEAFNASAEAAIGSALEAVKTANDQVSNAVLVAQGEPATDMDMPMGEPEVDDLDVDLDVDMDVDTDDFGGADAANMDVDVDGREMKESVTKEDLKATFAKIKK